MSDRERTESKRIKSVDFTLLPFRLVLTYEEVAIILNRSKRFVEDLVATKQLLPIEPGRISRHHLEDYIARKEREVATGLPTFAKSHPRPKRRAKSNHPPLKGS